MDLMKFLTWKEKKEDVVCRIVLIAVCQFLQVSCKLWLVRFVVCVSQHVTNVVVQ